MKRCEYERMLGLIELDSKNYQQRLSRIQSNIKSEDDAVIAKQVATVIKEIKLLERFMKCAIGEL